MSGPMDLSAATKMEELRDLALLVWREARGEPFEGQLAVAYSVLNRVARPSWWGTTLLTVIWKKWQYSSLTAPGDPQLHLQPHLPDPTWLSALGAAFDAIHAAAPNPVPGADSYYAVSMDAAGNPPKWAASSSLVKTIGRHHFYDLDHDYEKMTTGAV